MGGWHLRMTWGQEVCYTSLHSDPPSALSLLTVWLHWGNPVVAKCWKMATLPAGYILQRKVPSVIPSADADEMIMPALDLGTQSNMGAWPNSLDRRTPWYYISSVTYKNLCFMFQTIKTEICWCKKVFRFRSQDWWKNVVSSIKSR